MDARGKGLPLFAAVSGTSWTLGAFEAFDKFVIWLPCVRRDGVGHVCTISSKATRIQERIRGLGTAQLSRLGLARMSPKEKAIHNSTMIGSTYTLVQCPSGGCRVVKLQPQTRATFGATPDLAYHRGTYRDSSWCFPHGNSPSITLGH